MEAGETSKGTSSMATVRQMPSHASPMTYAGMRERKASWMERRYSVPTRNGVAQI